MASVPARVYAKRPLSQSCFLPGPFANTRPARRNPEKTNQSIAKLPPDGGGSIGASRECGATLVMLSVEVAAAPPELCTVAGVRRQVGASAALGETEQLRETDPLKPAIEVTVTVAVAD